MDETRVSIEGSGDMIRREALKWIEYLLAILLGNGLYFALNPHLPPPARYTARQLISLGTVVDFWFCLFVFGLLELGAYLHARLKKTDGG
jgi:hypothetical protein